MNSVTRAIRALTLTASVLAFTPIPVLADPAAPPTVKPLPSPAPPSKPAADDVGFYPAAARAGGVEGDASIHCERNPHLALRNCTLLSETPAGDGFGAAALAIAAKSPDNPKVNIVDPKDRPPISLAVRFRLHPDGVYPDLSEMGHVVLPPSLVSSPTKAQVQAAYPVRALSDGVDGVAVLDCLVTDKGALDRCRIYGETPTGYGFGAAALDLASDYVLKPRLFDGDPLGGAEVRVPVQFQSHDPAAPLELKTTPAP